MFDNPLRPGKPRRAYVDAQFDEARVADIRKPDQYGAFPGSWLDAIFGESLLIVPDTNVLRQDINAAVRDNRRGVLLTAANTGIFRLFCTERVVEEVERQIPDLAKRANQPLDAYIDRWNAEYLPLLRVIREEGLPLSVLSPAERSRIDALREPKEDAASVVLALSLGAFYLTKDQAAWKAVYGRSADRDELYGWLNALFEGHEAGELGRFCRVTMSLAVAATAGTINLARAFYKKSPVAFGAACTLAIAPLIVVASRTPRDRLTATISELGRGVSSVASFFGNEFYMPYYEAHQRFVRRAPVIPSWADLENSTARDDVLVRAVIHHLARSATGPMSAAELSRKLSRLRIGKSPKRIRECLRQHSRCFAQPYKGRWQVGWALASALK